MVLPMPTDDDDDYVDGDDGSSVVVGGGCVRLMIRTASEVVCLASFA